MMATMRAVRLHDVGGGKTELRLDNDVPVPTPKACAVLLAVRACGLNQVDLLTRDGQTPQTPRLRPSSRRSRTSTWPRTAPGHRTWKNFWYSTSSCSGPTCTFRRCP